MSDHDQGITELINGFIAESAGISVESLADPERRLDDLGMDSLGVIELLFEIEDRYGVYVDDPMELKDLTLGELYVKIAGLIESKNLKVSEQADTSAAGAVVAQTDEA